MKQIKSLVFLVLFAVAVSISATANAQYKTQTFTVGVKGQEKAPVEVTSILMAPPVLSNWDLKGPIEEGYREKAGAIAKEFSAGFVASLAEKGVIIHPATEESKGATIFVKVSYKDGLLYEAIRIGFWLVADKKLLKAFIHEAIVPDNIPVDISAKEMAKAVMEVVVIKP